MIENRRTFTEYVADELRAESARRDVTQETVARAIDRAQSYVSKRWRDAGALTIAEFSAWCSLLEIEPSIVLKHAAEKAPNRGVPAEPATTNVTPSRDDFDLVAKNPGREPDGDDEHFM